MGYILTVLSEIIQLVQMEVCIEMLEIDLKSRIPIYKQIYNSIEQLALKGLMAPNEQLLSVRQLARLMGINPNTITKAYWELEKSGIIYSVAGKGSFISPDLSLVSLDKKREIYLKLKGEIIEAKNIGIEKQSIIDTVTQIYETNSGVENL